MTDIIETTRERALAKGFKEGVISERLQTLGLLGRIAAAPNVELALHEEHEKLLALQAREVATLAAADVNARRVFSSTDEQLAFFERINTPGGAAPSGALDNGDLVARAMGLGPSAPAPHSAAPAPRAPVGTESDNIDKVAAAMALAS